MRSFIGVTGRDRAPRLATALSAVVLVAGACGGGDEENASQPSEPAPRATSAAGATADATPRTKVVIQMTDAFRFRPEKVVLKVGGKVTWTNPSTVVHTATADATKVADASHVEVPEGAAPWDSGLVQGNGAFTHEFTVPGTYRYACIPHENVSMFGTIEVVP